MGELVNQRIIRTPTNSKHINSRIHQFANFLPSDFDPFNLFTDESLGHIDHGIAHNSVGHARNHLTNDVLEGFIRDRG